MNITHNITMDLLKPGVRPLVCAVQGEALVRTLCFHLNQGDTAFSLPEDVRPVVRYRSENGCGGIYDTLPDGSCCGSVSANTVSVVLAPQVMACPGKVQVQVQLQRQEQILALFTLWVLVEEDPSATVMEAENYVNLQNQILELLEQHSDGSLQRLEALEQTVAQLAYIPVGIESLAFDHDSSFEMGQTLVQPELVWTLKGEACAASVNGESLAVPQVTRWLAPEDTLIRENTAFTLEVADAQGASDSRTVWLRFYSGVYYGASTLPLDDDDQLLYDSGFLLSSLERSLQEGAALTFTADAVDADDYIFFCLPSRWEEPVFTVGGIQGGFSKVASIPFTNASGYTEQYDIYRSDNRNLGQTTVVVS